MNALPHGHSESHAYFHLHHDGGHDNSHDDYKEEHYGPATYKYGYGVKDEHTGDHKDAWESSDHGVVKGSYSLYEPDGVHRVVEYTADKHHGFSATVKRTGGHHDIHEIDHWGH